MTVWLGSDCRDQTNVLHCYSTWHRVAGTFPPLGTTLPASCTPAQLKSRRSYKLFRNAARLQQAQLIFSTSSPHLEWLSNYVVIAAHIRCSMRASAALHSSPAIKLATLIVPQHRTALEGTQAWECGRYQQQNCRRYRLGYWPVTDCKRGPGAYRQTRG